MLKARGINMPDITKCEGTNCPLKERCYRYTSQPSEYLQSYFIGTPVKKDGTCEYLMPTDIKLKVPKWKTKKKTS